MADDLISLLRVAGILVSVSSSTGSKFAVRDKPVFTFCDLALRPYMIDIQFAYELDSTQLNAITDRPVSLAAEIDGHPCSFYPTLAGRSDELNATTAFEFALRKFGTLALVPLQFGHGLKAHLRHLCWAEGVTDA